MFFLEYFKGHFRVKKKLLNILDFFWITLLKAICKFKIILSYIEVHQIWKGNLSYKKLQVSIESVINCPSLKLKCQVYSHVCQWVAGKFVNNLVFAKNEHVAVIYWDFWYKKQFPKALPKVNMTKLMQWLAGLFAFLAIYIPLVTGMVDIECLRNFQYEVKILPIVIIALFGVSITIQKVLITQWNLLCS